MKKILFVLLLLISVSTFGQIPLGQGYTKSSLKYTYRAFGTDSGLHVPGYSTVPNIRTGVWTGSANIGVDTSNHRLYFYSGGSWRYSTASTGGGSIPINNIAAGTATNDVNHGNYEQSWRWNSLAGKGLRLLSSTTSADEGQNLFDIQVSGANAQSGITTYAANFSNSHTGTGAINVGANFAATGGAFNYAALFPSGSVGILTSTPDSSLHNAGSFHQVGNAKFDAKIHAPNLAAGNGTKAVRWDATAGFVLADTTAGGSTSPAGNFGNLQINRNGAFATPASDSLDFESATGLTVKGNITSSTLTAGRVPIVGTGGLLEDDAGLTYTKASDSLVTGQFTATKTDNYGTDVGIIQIKRDALNATGNVRGFYDNTRFSTITGQRNAYASYDSYVNSYPAAGDTVGHITSFQSRPKQYNSGMTQRVVDFVAANSDLAAGKWGTKIGFEYYNVVNGAALDSQYAIYIHGLSAGSMQNRGIFEEDGVSNIFGGETFVKGILQVNSVIAPGVSRITMGGDNPNHTSRLAFYEGVAGANMYGIGMANPSSYGVATWVNVTPSASNMSTFVDLDNNFLIGGSVAGTTAAKSIQLFNGTAPTANISGVQITAVSGELQVRNSGGEVSLLTGQKNSRVSTQYDNTTTTLGNITGLTSNVAAGKTYRFEAKLYTTSNVGGGIKVAIAGTATATAIIYEGLTSDAGLTTQSRATAMAAAVGAVTAVTAAYVVITGTITVNAAGTLTCQAAANAAVGTTSVLVGSTFVITEIL